MADTPIETKDFTPDILKALKRSGTTLANVEHGRSLLFLLSAIIPYFSFGILWKKKGELGYQRLYTTIMETDYRTHSNHIIRSFESARFNEISKRQRDTLETRKPIKNLLFREIAQIKVKTIFGANLVADFLILIPCSENLLAEIYVGKNIPEEQLTGLQENSKEISKCLNSRLVQIYEVLKQNKDFLKDFHDSQGNRHLFRQIFRDMKTWFGEDFRDVNIFTFDPRDRLLYHLETSHLKVNKIELDKYKPTPEIEDPYFLQHIKENIDNNELPRSIKPESLKELLSDLSNKKSLSKKVEIDNGDLLKQLLSFIPQEPGTGIAGETAITRIPQLGLDASDPRWQAFAPEYRNKFFAIMLPVEQIFGIGSSGNKMAAVPLMESGQFWGVLFLVQNVAYTNDKLIELWEKAHHISSFLSLFRSFQFQKAILNGAAKKPNTPLAKLALKNIHLALNPILAIHWQLHGTKGGMDDVEVWQFDGEPKRFGPTPPKDPNRRPFNDYDIKKEIHNIFKKGKIKVIDLLREKNEAVIGIPENYKFPELESIRSAMMIPIPPYDVLAVYLDEDAETLEQFLPQFEERFSCLWDVEHIRESKKSDEKIITRSKEVRLLMDKARRIVENSDDKSNILILGETGTGKDLLAEYIHNQSGRNGNYVTVNISAVPGELLESELFGFKKGAHNTAFKDKKGLIEEANRGTLFLDEIGDLPPQLQAKLLRVIQDRKFTPVGDTKSVEADIILVAATDQLLKQLIMEGKFRQALYQRLSQFKLELPPLRDRKEDVPSLVRHFLHKRFPRKHLRLSAAAMAHLININWVGNIRDLEHTIDRTSVYKNNISVFSKEDLDIEPENIEQVVEEVQAKKITNYIGLDESEDDGCRGWALFSPDTYDIDIESPSEDWSQITFSAFRRFKDLEIKVDSYCSIGCGPGLDAIIAVNTFESQQIHLTDINEKVLALAEENVRLNDLSNSVKINLLESDLFQSFSGSERFDLIYENLPNLPWSQNEPLHDRKWATFCQPKIETTDNAEKWLLSMHEHFLKGARNFLNPEGQVVCCIGARVPWKAIVEMFKDQGFEPKLIHFGIKKQQQPEEVIEGYAKAEAEGKGEFRFLDLDLARELINGKMQENPETLLALFESDDFKKARLTAQEAIEEFTNKGKTIGHGVYVVSGKLI